MRNQVVGITGFAVIFLVAIPSLIEHYSMLQENADKMNVACRRDYTASTVEFFDYIISKTLIPLIQ